MELMYITTKGLEYFAQTAKGKILHFTKGKFGDGAYTGETPVSEMTELLNPLGEMPISKQKASGTLVTITTQFSNKVNGKILNAFNLKEIGLFAKVLNSDGTEDATYPEMLVAYAYAQGADTGDRIPGVLTEFTYNWTCTVSDSSNVTVEVGSMVYVSQSDFDDATKELQGDIDEAKTQIKNKVEKIENMGLAGFGTTSDSDKTWITVVVVDDNGTPTIKKIPAYTSDLENDSGFAKITYGTDDLTAGESTLETGTLYFVYE